MAFSPPYELNSKPYISQDATEQCLSTLHLLANANVFQNPCPSVVM